MVDKVECKFLTEYATTTKTNEANISYTEHNQLFLDEDGELLLVPRLFKTDGYTIPNIIAPLIGGKMRNDIRPAIQHDFECRYKKKLVVDLCEVELLHRNLVRVHKKKINGITYDIMICEDIPRKYLSLKPTSFNETNCRFKRMMKAVGIGPIRHNIMRAGVNLNIGWGWDKLCTSITGKEKEIDLRLIYDYTI